MIRQNKLSGCNFGISELEKIIDQMFISQSHCVVSVLVVKV